MIDMLTASDATNERSPLHRLDVTDETAVIARIGDVLFTGDEMTDEQALRLRVILRAVVQNAQGAAMTNEPQAMKLAA